MTVRKPLVNVTGTISELPAGDTLASSSPTAGARPIKTDTYTPFSAAEGSVSYTHEQLVDGPMFAAITQMLGYTAGNTVEVEANTRAARVTLRGPEGAAAQEQWFAINHHALGVCPNFSATASWPTNSEVFTMALPFSGSAGHCIAMIRKVQISAARGAQVGAVAGNARFELFNVSPVFDVGGITRAILPPWQDTSNGLNTSSLKTRQGAPTVTVTRNANTAPTLTSMTGNNPGPFTKSYGSLIGPCPAAAGITILSPTCIFDCNVSMYPIVVANGQGIQLAATLPAAATSQTVLVAANIIWDEWVPVPQIGM